MPAVARVGRLFVLLLRGTRRGWLAVAVSQLLISLSRAGEVSNFEQTATKERMILHVRPPERHPPSPDTPRRPD
jgi:hypothetical protein